MCLVFGCIGSILMSHSKLENTLPPHSCDKVSKALYQQIEGRIILKNMRLVQLNPTKCEIAVKFVGQA